MDVVVVDLVDGNGHDCDMHDDERVVHDEGGDMLAVHADDVQAPDDYDAPPASLEEEDSRRVTASERTKVTAMQYAAYHTHDRDPANNAIFNFGRRLYQEWIVDQWAKCEGQRLTFLRFNQKKLRVDLYKGLSDAVHAGDANLDDRGTSFVLPSSFTGGPRHMHQLYQDSMSIVRAFGKPDLFITMTCNTKWEEIQRELRAGETANDRPDIVARVFRMKLQHLMRDLTVNGVLGRVVADIHVIEFQKRGLPHAHILLILAPEDKPRNANDIDKFVCAELPDKVTHPRLHRIVTSCMLHGPCGERCMERDEANREHCSKGFPKLFQEVTVDAAGAYPLYQRREFRDKKDGAGNVVLDANGNVVKEAITYSKETAGGRQG
jgi:hypothetical protein